MSLSSTKWWVSNHDSANQRAPNLTANQLKFDVSKGWTLSADAFYLDNTECSIVTKELTKGTGLELLIFSKLSKSNLNQMILDIYNSNHWMNTTSILIRIHISFKLLHKLKVTWNYIEHEEMSTILLVTKSKSHFNLFCNKYIKAQLILTFDNFILIWISKPYLSLCCNFSMLFQFLKVPNWATFCKPIF